MKRTILALGAAFMLACAPARPPSAPLQPASGKPRVIVLVWDGLRPDSVKASTTPRLFDLARRGTFFADHHATYPTFTMTNAASFATGAFAEQTGFYGNTLFQPKARGNDAQGKPLPFEAPIFTEDYWVLAALQTVDEHLLLTDTLFQSAKKAGLKTATVGKSGPIFLQDLGKGDVVLDEKVVFPPSFGRELQRRGFALPSLADKAASEIDLKVDNGMPTAFGPKKFFDDGVTPDASDRNGTLCHQANRYLMDVFTEGVLPLQTPDLSVVWLRNPDTTQHAYGPGSPNALDALASQDLLLGMLLDRLEKQGLASTTDLLIVSDHGHSNVSGPLDLFPLRGVKKNVLGDGTTWGAVSPDGYSVSGDVRLAELLSAANFTAYDGVGCVYDPVLSGITAAGTQLRPDRVDTDGTACGEVGKKYTTRSHKVPSNGLGKGALVVAANGGSDYLYVPDHDSETVAKVVRFLQSREEFGAIFVASRYGALPGTLPLERLHLEDSAGRNPDLIVSYSHDENAVVQGMRGIVFQSAGVSNQRGMHGSFSPIDVHNTLIAVGPHFRSRFTNPLPTGNVDVAPTVAHLLGLALPSAAGRVLSEALVSGREVRDYRVAPGTLAPSAPATDLTVVRATGARDGVKSSYTFEVKVKDLTLGAHSFRYFDGATATRR
ncbi:MAG TPA: alkaline phosphatase family protein [Polyangiaceae bacterium]|nr:alkaline phosphatase family protein [Polyangiaceae bacterium]